MTPTPGYRNLLLHRGPSTPSGMLGVLSSGDPDLPILHTLECPKGTEEESRTPKSGKAIPAGKYALGYHAWDKHPEMMVYYLKGVPGGRFPIDIHIGNTIKDTTGCILLGMFSSPEGTPATVWESKKAYGLFMASLSGSANAQIEILDYQDPPGSGK